MTRKEGFTEIHCYQGTKHSENRGINFNECKKNLTLLRTLNLIDKKISKNINNFNMYSYQGK